MNDRRVLRRAAGGLVVAVALGSGTMAASAQSDPTVSIDRTGTAAGEEMVITGTGWPAHATLIVELCGHGGLDGSTDCDVPHQRTASAGEDGRFATALTVGVPPRPCPCVVKATDQFSHLSAVATIAVQNVPTVPIAEDEAPTRAVDVIDARITGGSWTELFGTPSPRTLHLTIENTGNVTITDPDLAVTWGRGARPTGFVEVPDVGPLAPGEQATAEVPLPRAALSIGRYTAFAELAGLGPTARASTHDTIVPWGLVAVAVVVLQVGLVAARNRLRRRVLNPNVVPVGPQPPLPLGPGRVPEWPDPVRIDERVPVPAQRDPEFPAVFFASIVAHDDAVIDVTDARVGDDLDAAIAVPCLDGADALLAEHQLSMALLAAALRDNLAASAQSVEREITAIHHHALSALEQVAQLAEAMITEALARSEQALAEADRRRQEASDRLPSRPVDGLERRLADAAVQARYRPSDTQ